MNDEPATPAQVMADLELAARALDKASDRLGRAMKEFEGQRNEQGDWKPGPQLRWRIAVSEAIEQIVDDKYADTRAPSVERLERQAEIRVMKTDPDLYADYHRLSTEIDALKKWIGAKKESISARQSILSAEKALVSGLPNR